jgi:ParB-like chromosome segregation protein Spo0J
MIQIGEQQIIMLDPEELTPNPWNPNSVGVTNMDKLKASLQNNGFFKPVLYRELEDGTKEIIGGEHRVQAAQELGMQVPTMSLGKIGDAQAKKFTLMDNDGYGENDSNLLARVLKDLEAGGVDIVGEMTYDQEELSSLLDMTTSVNMDVLDELENLDLDDAPSTTSDNTEHEGTTYKTLKIKVDIADAEFVEDLIGELIDKRGIDDSDKAVERGQLFRELLEAASDE